jgi:hypothetical protein
MISTISGIFQSGTTDFMVESKFEIFICCFLFYLGTIKDFTVKKLLLLVLLLGFFSGYSQKIILKQANFKALKGETSIRLEFLYENILIMHEIPEKDYVAKRKAELNLNEAESGTEWESKWYGDRKEKFEPKFALLFAKYSKLQLNEEAKYTLILKTTAIEPGWPEAKIDAEVLVVETVNRENVLARIVLQDIPGQHRIGADFATGLRLQEAYAKAGKDLGKVFNSKIH